MTCPVCKSHEFVKLDLHVDQFSEILFECKVCASTWSVNHGISEVVRDAQAKSFLEATTECVEGDDYSVDRGF